GNIDKRPVKQFSLGMKQRFSLPLSFLPSPPFLLFSSPPPFFSPLFLPSFLSLLSSFPSSFLPLLLSLPFLSSFSPFF
ncbi:lantibiotic ABC transporter ATP-binding protein, partial [Streptococcus pyogenes]